MKAIKTYINQNKERFLSELFDFLRIPSISADSNFKKAIQKATHFLREKLEGCGFKVEITKPKVGHPIVYAKLQKDEKLPTILVYGHYDVQPADPIDLWDNPPFDPIIKNTKRHPNGAIFARGACDDKGQIYAHIKSVELLIKTNRLNCNVAFLIEGEEEIGSSNLEEYLFENKQKLHNDIILVSDTAMLSLEQPTITTGLKGLCYFEIEATGPNKDLHSGVYGGTVLNPAVALCQILASLHDDKNRVAIPGFYDAVEVPKEKLRTSIAEIPFSLEYYKSDLGIDQVWGEKGYTTNERNSIRPTLDINGIWGGYTGEGAKTIIPSKAHAKVSMRLVSNQDWRVISEQFCRHIKNITPKGIDIKIETCHGAMPYYMDFSTKAFKIAAKAYQRSFGKPALPQPTGGSIPIVPLFEKYLGTKTLLMGFGFDTDAIHSPNEHFGVDNYLKAIETISYFYELYAESTSD